MKAAIAAILLATVAVVAVTLSTAPRTAVKAQAATPGSVALVDHPFRCPRYPQPLDLDLVKVTLTASYTGTIDDAVYLAGGDCHGRIGRVEIDTWVGDGIKVGATTHDLEIESGYVYCHARKPGKHQDGFQALGGVHVHLANLSVYCPPSNNASFFVTSGAAGSSTPSTPDWPTDVTCRNCTLQGGAQTVSIASSIDSGVLDSVVHTGKFTARRVQPEAVRPVFVNDVVLPPLDPAGSG